MPSTEPIRSAAPQQGEASPSRPGAATAVAVLGIIGMVGAAAMVVFHLVQIYLPAVAGGFVLGVALFAAVAYGAWTRTSWAWPVALVVNGLGLISSVMPWRGLEMSGPPALVTLAALIILVSRPGRDALLYRRPE